MQALRSRRTAALFSIVAVLFGGPAYSQPMPPERDKEEAAWKGLAYKSAADCTQCHVQPTLNYLPEEGKLRALDLVLMTEYSIWKTHDKHAQAYAVLEGPRGKRIGEVLGLDVRKPETGCLNCHAMGNLAAKGDSGVDMKDGVSCAGCHGPCGGGVMGWFSLHSDPSWRKLTADEKFQKGMRDLRDPATRASLCLSCHIGNVAEGKVVTHAMFAAGHPPLPPIEIASFSRNEPQHWRDANHVPYFQNLDKVPEAERAARVKNYHLEDVPFNRTKFALVGALVSMRESMRLAQQRSDFTNPAPKAAWPELLVGRKDAATDDDLRKDAAARWPEIATAQSDCFSCHHELKYPGYRQARGFGYQWPLADKPPIQVVPGRVMLRTWPTAPLISVFDFLDKPDQRGALYDQLKGLADAVNSRPYGSPDAVRDRTTDAIKWCDATLAELKAVKYDAASVKRLILSLCALYDKKDARGRPVMPDYEMARLIASVLSVAYEDWKESKGMHASPAQAKAATDAFAALTKQLDLEPYSRRKARLDVVFDIVAQGKPLEGKDEFKQYLATRDSIGNLEELKKLVKNTPFLDAIRKISNDEFNKGLLDPKNIALLQKQGDEEEDTILKSVANYDPDDFKKQLKILADSMK
jgi:hypothetical protein